MQKLTLILLLSSFLVHTFFVLRAKTLPDPFLGTKKLTKLTFYVQEIRGGDNITVYVVAKTNISDKVPSRFGIVAVLDHQITYDRDIKSGEFGLQQGIVAASNLRRFSLTVVITFVITSGNYKGSTFNIVGRSLLPDRVRELSIAGGTGIFKMATGYVITKTCVDGEPGLRNVYEYNAYIYYYVNDGLLS